MARKVFVKKVRAPYIVTTEGELYYRGPGHDVLEIDDGTDVATIRDEADRDLAKSRHNDLPPWNR